MKMTFFKFDITIWIYLQYGRRRFLPSKVIKRSIFHFACYCLEHCKNIEHAFAVVEVYFSHVDAFKYTYNSSLLQSFVILFVVHLSPLQRRYKLASRKINLLWLKYNRGIFIAFDLNRILFSARIIKWRILSIWYFKDLNTVEQSP